MCYFPCNPYASSLISIPATKLDTIIVTNNKLTNVSIITNTLPACVSGIISPYQIVENVTILK
jgi:hypothetical protein